MRAVDIIAKKRDGLVLSREEIEFFVRGLTTGEIPDYQVAAWAMAVFLRGMDERETYDLTMAMVRSGSIVDLSDLATVVDKHSTGGVGDKTTLVVAPLVAAAGQRVAKMSGRGLGFTGGTIDKLEAIPGFRTALTTSEFVQVCRQVGVVVASQTADLVPADAVLYALRDVTATVESIPLIASSIMSKKIAAGAHGIVLDVKVGRGAFMSDVDEARRLAQMMLEVGVRAGRRVTAVLSGMDQPLGRAVGNALEVIEAIDVLKGGGPLDLREHCLVIAEEMVSLAEHETPLAVIRGRLEEALRSGQALEVFRRWVAAQDGDPRVVETYDILPQAPVRLPISAPQTGYVETLDAREVGLTCMMLGAGRERKGEQIDLSVGVTLQAKPGDRLERGDTLAIIHARDERSAYTAGRRLLGAYTWSDLPPEQPPLIHEVMRR